MKTKETENTQKKNPLSKAKEKTVALIDQNGDGKIDIEDVIIMGLSLPGTKIDRQQFLQKELSTLLPQEIIDKAINSTPTLAGIPDKVVDKIADETIKFERNCVSGISAALGMPGGFALVATIPADIAQYFGYMLRTAQKLMYLYGFPQIELDKHENVLDTATLNVLIICLGVMYGVHEAKVALLAISKAFAKGVEKKLLNTALTKGAIYPIVKKVATWFGIKMNKQVFAGFFKNAIPVVGGVAGGAITYLSFKPCCVKLQNALKDTYLHNPDRQENLDEEIELKEEAE